MFNIVSSKSVKGGASPQAVRPKQKPAGRERLRHFDQELAKANAAAVEIEERIQRLEKIISDADSAHERLQIAILVDNGASLASYSSGQATDDSEIGRLVITADTTARAKAAAVAALPGAQSSLVNVREQAVRLSEERAVELNRVVANLADVEAVAYAKAFREVCRLHDRLAGFCRSGAESNIGDIQRIIDPVKVPRFALPSLGGSPDSDPFLRHATNDLVVNEAARYWKTVREKLDADSNADIGDLV
jgi:hypothetical protein